MAAESEVATISYQNEEQLSFSTFNLKSGLQVSNFKGGQCSSHCLGSFGNDYILTAQDRKQLIHVWDLRKEQIHMKIVCPGKITAICCSPDGNYCLVALMEKIYIWQVPTGNLMQILSKHYQPVTCLKFTDDGSHFVSGADDNLVIVWNLSRVLSVSDGIAKKNQQPTHTWSHHSLPVKDIHVGLGGLRCRVATCSLDQTCKLYDLASGQLLSSLLFNTGLTSVTMDAAENHLFVGGITGKIHLIKLYQKRKQEENNMENNKTSEVFQGHSKEITSLSVNQSGTILMSGSSDCTARVWHINSGQCVRQMSFKGKVTNAVIIRKPKDITVKKPFAMTRPISNFKRKIFEPFRNASWDDPVGDDDASLPIVLKSIDKAFLKVCSNNKDCYESKEIEDVMEELYKNDLDEEMSSQKTNQMSRTELIHRVEQLEILARKLCKFSANNIINEVNNS